MSTKTAKGNGAGGRPASRTIQTTLLSSKDLPLSCPPGNDPEANRKMHPRVFLHVDENGLAKCPYCGACYLITK